ncbi:hypothetical protein HKD37_12G034639 [Glycine soja]
MIMEEDQSMYDNVMCEKVYMNDQNEDEGGVNEEHVDCFDAFNISQLRAKPVVGGEGWMMNLTCGSHNNELAKSLVGYPYAGRLTKDEKIIVADMTKSMVKPRNILLTLKEHNNVKAKCKTLFGQKNAWDYLMEACGSLVDCPPEQQFDECLKKFEIACSPWPMVESAHWVLKRLLQNSLGDLCSVWEAMNNMITLQHTEVKASFDTCDQGLSERLVSITEEMETISKRFEELDICGKVTSKSKLREISYLDLNSICAHPKKVKTKSSQKRPMTKQQRSTKCDLSYWEYVNALHSAQNGNSSGKRSASSSEQPIQRKAMPMLDQFHPCIHDSIVNIVNVKVDDKCGYRAIAALLGISKRPLSVTANNIVMVYTLSLSGKAVAHTIYY